MTLRALSSFLVSMTLAVTAIGLGSCRENIIIQSNLTPGTDAIGTDTLVLPDSFFTARTVYDDSLVTSTKSATYNVYHALGWLTGDIYSGRTAGNIYVQIVPRATSFNFTPGDIPDSAVLVIPYGGFTWGDTTVRSEQRITAYELDDTLSNNSSYYTFNRKAVKPTPIGAATFYTGPAGSGVIQDSVALRNNLRVPPHLRVRLTGAFLANLQGILADTSKTSSFAAFLNAFRGFYLRADTLNAGVNPGKAMPYFRINGSSDPYGQTNLLVYAHNAATDTIVYQLPFNTTYTAHYNQITRNYSDQSIFSPGNPVLMVQNQPGAAIELNLRYLRNIALPNGLKLSDIVINRASLVFTEIPATISDRYIHPPRIYPVGIDAAGTKYGILDRYPLTTDDGLNFIDARPRTNGALTTYTINLPREFQQAIVQQKSELHLRINGTQTYPAAYRLLVGNKNNPDYRFAFKIIYSKQK